VTAHCPSITATNILTQAAGANGKLSKLPAIFNSDVAQVAQRAFDARMKGDAICCLA